MSQHRGGEDFPGGRMFRNMRAGRTNTHALIFRICLCRFAEENTLDENLGLACVYDT